ncbi:FAD-dependent oxidoreductase [Streptomyces sp. HMX112]|uniref:FAD-dependent oxidoreductase n=1 Tax=Streptomyces sp. HMX112 TaxID=3390850 RepID=UPI003A80BEA4
MPDRLVVIGGGVVACEMAPVWSSLGSSVTLLVRDQALLTGWGPCAGEEVTRGLSDLGVTVRFGVSTVRVARDADTRTVTVNTDDGTDLVCDEVLAAVGRRPRTADLGLDSVGLPAGDWLPVGDTCRVTAVEGAWLYAVGDVNHRAPLTHMAKYQARACAAAIAERAAGRPAVTGGMQPRTRHRTDPVHRQFAADVPAADAAVMAATQRSVATAALEEKAGEAARKTIPSWALIATADQNIPPAAERWMARRAGSHITEVDASHAVAVPRPAVVTAVILDAVRKTR